MDSKIRNQLEEARAHFYAYRMAEAYAILRRFFDRLPFEAVPEHGEFIGIFAMVLAELGKSRDLSFYLNELEKRYSRSKQVYVTFALASVYMNGPDPRPELARRLFDEILRGSGPSEYRNRARMELARYYDRYQSDYATCRLLIDAMESPIEERLQVRIQIWRAKLLRDEKKFDEAEMALKVLLSGIDFNSNWYAYVSTKIILGNLYAMRKQMDLARQELQEILALSTKQEFRSLKAQLQYLSEKIESEGQLKPMRLEKCDLGTKLSVDDRTVLFRRKSLGEKLVRLLIRRRVLDRGAIMKALYDREYRGKQDDTAIYYQIRSVRRRLSRIGVSSDAIVAENESYRFVPEVETLEGDI